MKILVISLLTLVIPCLANWTKPIQVINTYHANYTRPDTIFTDEGTGISHILWCHSKDHLFHYRQIKADGTVSKVIIFNWKYLCTSKYIISGFHDKKSLYIVYQGKRSMSTKNCIEDPKGCNDIYFSESSNGGITWLAPIAVPRKNMTDQKERVSPRFLVSARNRLWIFYQNLMETANSISYVSRSPRSTVFSTERTLDLNIGKDMSVAYASNNTKSLITIFYSSHKNRSNYRYYTENNGISWKGPYLFTGACEDYLIYTYPFNTIQVPSYLIATCRDSDWYDYLSISTNLGENWYRSNIPFGSYTEKYSVSGDGKGNGLFAHGDTKVYYMDLHKSRFSETENPPLPEGKTCVSITSTYKPLKFWYWYEMKNEDGTKSLWFTSIQIDKKTGEYQ